MDQYAPNECIISLIFAHANATKCSERQELEGLRARDLVARAQAADLGEAALDAMDEADPKAALVDLLLQPR